MKIITRGEAMRIHQQHPTSRLFPFCTGKYRWHGSAEAYTGREVQDIPGVLAVFAERRKDSFGPYVRLMSVTLNDVPLPVICYVPIRGHTRFCGLSAWGCQKRSVVWSSHSSGVMVSVSFIWMPVPDICRVYPLSTGNPEIHNMKSLTTETALDILITWLQDNIDCESGIIFDNDEDKTDSAALLPCIAQAREGIRTLRQQ